jgi:hypothetical protein
MENKKLLKYLLKDLSELEEMFTENGKNSFDDLEMEFIQNRVSGAKRLVQLFFEHENEVVAEVKSGSAPQQKPDLQNVELPKEKAETIFEEKKVEIKPGSIAPGVWVEESTPVVGVPENMQEVVNEEKAPGISIEEKIQEQLMEEVEKQVTKLRQVAVQQELQLEDEQHDDTHQKRLGDLFSKEKSVNDLKSADLSNLEHKLSNRPVTSLHSAIGINDRFQYIRELFEGSVDNFVKTVADLDSMDDIKDAVDYLQTNFKWKKNDTSLKFVNLIKRRFPNE